MGIVVDAVYNGRMNTKIIIAAVAASAAFSAFSDPVVVDAAANGTKFSHYWSFSTCAGRVNEGLRAGWREQLLRAKKECGFGYVRMHDLFNDDMGVCFRERNGRLTYNWQYVDDVYDFLVDNEVRPFVELSFFPSAIAATNTIKQMWYRNCITPCEKSYGEWHDLVKAFTEHVVARYGIDEVRKWYFEVWNEPNLSREIAPWSLVLVVEK